jgi:hypothetical protein
VARLHNIISERGRHVHKTALQELRVSELMDDDLEDIWNKYDIDGNGYANTHSDEHVRSRPVARNSRASE